MAKSKGVCPRCRRGGEKVPEWGGDWYCEWCNLFWKR